MPEREEPRSRTPSPDKCRSVLDGPECIAGVPSGTNSPAEQASPDRAGVEACNSVLDGPECIKGVQAPPRQR